MARHVRVGRGKGRQGKAVLVWRGGVWQGWVRQGRLGLASHGTVRRGEVWRGKPRFLFPAQ